MHPNSQVTGIVTEGGEVEKSFTEKGSEREEKQQIDKWKKKWCKRRTVKLKYKQEWDITKTSQEC